MQAETQTTFNPLREIRLTEAAVFQGDVVAVARSYEDLVSACRLRRHELGLPQLVVDDIAGLQSGYTGKLEVGVKRMGPMSMPCLLGALGLELVVVRIVPHHERRLKQVA